jgi:glycosyltransferase involved in cell wall biosynthesis
VGEAGVSASTQLRAWLRTWQAEGTAAVRDRVLDRWADARERSASSGPPPSWPAPPVLNVLGVEPTTRWGGVPLQWLARLRREAEHRPIATLVRGGDGAFHLEWRHAGARWSARFAGFAWERDPLLADGSWLETVDAARALVGAAGVHVENLAELSLVSLDALASTGVPLVVSLHDFGGFCRRPHLWQSAGGFCDYSTDDARCRTCLDATLPAALIDQRAHRRLAASVLQRASLVIFPSAFLRDRLAALLAWDAGRPHVVIEPGIEAPAGLAPSRRDPAEVAFVGGPADHKGGARLARLAAILTAHGCRVSVYGGHGHHHLDALRRVDGVRVRGYFRAGTLPALLARQGASVAVLLSRVPESFGLTLSEAWAAGVPVVAPAQGALADRLQGGGGILVAAEPSDHDVLQAIDAVRHAPLPALPEPPSAARAADEMRAAYARAGLTTVS